MEKGIEKIFKAIAEGIVDIGNDCIFGPFAPLSDKVVGLVKESFETEPTSYNLAVEECENYIPENLKIYSPIIVTAVELCIEQLDLIESYNYEENKSIENITKQYIERYCKQFGEDELGALRNFLDIIIKKTLESLQLTKENDPEFRIKFKQEVSKKFYKVDTTLREQSSDIHEMQKRLENKNSKTSSVNECHEKYRNDWDKPMFLTEKINLCDLHMLPYYKDKREGQHKDLELRLRAVLDSNEDKRWENTIKQKLHSRTVLDLNEDKRNYMLLILGHPGYGKTTLMTYVLNHYSDELARRKRIVRMYCFRSFESINWNSKPENLFGEMLDHMDLKIKDLNNSLLILDGLDEINMGDNQIQFLNCVCEDWVESKK